MTPCMFLQPSYSLLIGSFDLYGSSSLFNTSFLLKWNITSSQGLDLYLNNWSNWTEWISNVLNITVQEPSHPDISKQASVVHLRDVFQYNTTQGPPSADSIGELERSVLTFTDMYLRDKGFPYARPCNASAELSPDGTMTIDFYLVFVANTSSEKAVSALIRQVILHMIASCCTYHAPIMLPLNKLADCCMLHLPCTYHAPIE